MVMKGFLVFELINGGELFDFIVEQHTLSEKVASSFIQQILGVLDYCHKRGRVHFYSLATTTSIHNIFVHCICWPRTAKRLELGLKSKCLWIA